MSEAEPTKLHLGTRNHLMVTDGLVIHGTVSPCPGRLSDLLRGYKRGALSLSDVELTGFDAQEHTECVEVRVSLDSLILAHEYVALGGDEHQRVVRRGRQSTNVGLHFEGLPRFSLNGLVAPEVLEREDRFFSLVTPGTEGDVPLALAECLQDLPYVLVNRDRVSCVLMLDARPGPQQADDE